MLGSSQLACSLTVTEWEKLSAWRKAGLGLSMVASPPLGIANGLASGHRAPRGGSKLPSSPPPNSRYLVKTRERGVQKQPEFEQRARYQAMRERFDQLAALGLLDRSPWERETFSSHLGLAAKHAQRACSLAVTRMVQACCQCCRSKSSQDNTPPLSEEDREISEKRLLLPTGRLKEKWDVLILLCICYSAVVVPFRVGFDVSAIEFSHIWDLEVSMTIAFLIDMVLSFNTAVFDAKTGRWLTDRSAIAASYLRGWFWIDAPSSVPVEIIALFIDAQGAAFSRRLPPPPAFLSLLRHDLSLPQASSPCACCASSGSSASPRSSKSMST